MSITDELREWAHGFNGPWKRNEEMLTAIADRIDAEHERAMADAELAAAPTEAQLEEWGYVELPRDADGVPWTGEETEFVTENGKALDLDTFCYHARGGRWSIHGHTMTGSIESYNPSDCRHIPDTPADPHAELADELDIFASTRISDKDDASMLQDIADRLRKIGGGQ